MKNVVTILFFLFIAQSIFAAEPYRGTVEEFVGLNTNVGAYDDKIVERLGHAAKWMREYHSWGHYERTPDVYLWDDKTQSSAGTWPHHTKYVEQCRTLGIDLLICAQGSTDWMAVPGASQPSASPPIGEEDGTQPEHYLEKIEFVSQLVARYGSTVVENDLLETTDKKTGLGYITYYEDWNEPDQDWWQPTWPGHLYGIYVNSLHDGANLTPNAEYPILGIKNTDPNAVHVMGGVAGFSESYMAGILQAAGGRVPFDIINFHTYCTQGWGTSRGYAPEHSTYGLKREVDKWQTWRDEHAPGKPIWLTEFGWDTYKNGNSSSYVYAGEEAQANYLVRSIFLLMGYGIDKAFIFFDKDPNSMSTQQYSSSGILTDKSNGLKAKPSFYYLATMQNLIGDYHFVAVDKYADGDPNVYSYLLQSPLDSTNYCFVLWCRNGKSGADDGTTISNYEFAQPGLKNAVLIEPVDESETGQEIPVMIENAGAENALVTIPTLSEKPVFLLVESDYPLSVKVDEVTVSNYELRAYPNPFNSDVKIEYDLAKPSDVRLAVYDVNGRLVDHTQRKPMSAGHHQYRFDFSVFHLSSGVYLVQLWAGEQVLNKKICHIK